MRRLPLSIAALLETALIAAPAAAQSPAAPPPVDASEPAIALIQAHCAACHESGQVLAAKKTPAEWATTIDTMIGYGAELDSANRGVIERYLAEHNAP